MKNKTRSLLFDRNFWPLCWTQFLGAFNDNFFKTALVLLITFHSLNFFGLSSEKVVAMCGGVFILPFFIFSAFAGQIADRYEKSRLIMMIKIFEIIIMSIGVIGFLTLNIHILLLTLFFTGFQSSLFGPLKYSYMPQRIAPARLVEANALLQITTFLAILLGTIGGGMVVASQQNSLMYLNTSVVTVAVIGFLFSLFILKEKSLQSFSSSVDNLDNITNSQQLLKPKETTIQLNPFRSMRSVLSYIFKQRKIILPIVGMSWFWFCGAVMLSVLPSYGKNILGGDEYVVTFLLSLFSIGISIGCLICKKFARDVFELGMAPIGTFVISVFMLDLFLVDYFYTIDRENVISIAGLFNNFYYVRIVLDLTMIAIGGGLFFVPLMTFLQKYTVKTHLARAIAGGHILDSFFIVLSSIILIICFSLGFTEPQIMGLLSVANVTVTGCIFYYFPYGLLEIKNIITYFIKKNKSFI